MRMGPAGSPTTFPLTHFDGDTFSFESVGENANGLAGALFAGTRRRLLAKRHPGLLRQDRAGDFHPGVEGWDRCGTDINLPKA